MKIKNLNLNVLICSNFSQSFFLINIIGLTNPFQFYNKFLVKKMFSVFVQNFSLNNQLFNKLLKEIVPLNLKHKKNIGNDSKKKRRIKLNYCNKIKCYCKFQHFSIKKNSSSQNSFNFERIIKFKYFNSNRILLFSNKYNKFMKQEIQKQFALFRVLIKNFFILNKNIKKKGKIFEYKKNRLNYTNNFFNIQQELKIGEVFRKCGHLFFRDEFEINYLSGKSYKRGGNKIPKLFKFNLYIENINLRNFSSASLKKIISIYKIKLYQKFLYFEQQKEPAPSLNHFGKIFSNEYGFFI